jgi:hypothetical protein
MKIQQFLEHHYIERNPFAEEDAQTDPVFKEHCIDSTYHPTWDKVYGDPREPSTSVVFGEKGSGKTAMRLQIGQHLSKYNEEHPHDRVFIVEYDDFNPFLDRFRGHMHGRNKRPDRTLKHWQLWDHMDAILVLAVTGIMDRILGVGRPSQKHIGEIRDNDLDKLDRHQKRDLLLLAACYDQSSRATPMTRWTNLKTRLGFSTWKASLDFYGAIGWTALSGILSIILISYDWNYSWLLVVYLLIILAGWVPFGWRWLRRMVLARKVVKRMRVGNHEANPLRKILMEFTNPELLGQPTPHQDRTDDRYDSLNKLQGVLETLGFNGVVVLFDRLDEPHLINGKAEHMKLFLWPMLDNKFLKHSGMGFKLMLPVELTRYVEREDSDFYQRARLDKQNMVSNFQWTGEALTDVANARIAACATGDKPTTLRDLFDPSLSDQRLLESLRSLRVPRHLFKFMYRILVEHCNAYTDEQPKWVIPAERFESTLAVYLRDQDAFERGMGAG